MAKKKFAESDFFTSSYSQTGSVWRCVKVAMKDGVIAVRDSKDTKAEKTTLEFNKDEWQAFIDGVKNGEFDLKK